MHITAQGHLGAKLAVDVLVIPVTAAQSTKLTGGAAKLDKEAKKLLSDLITQEKFSGEFGEQQVIRTMGRLTATKVLLLGTGTAKPDAKAYRKLAAIAVKAARKEKAKEIAFVLDSTSAKLTSLAQGITEGAMLGDYRFLKYQEKARKEYAENMIESFMIVVQKERKVIVATEKGIQKGEIFARGTIFARGLVNEPASAITPRHLRDIAMAIADARKKDGISIKVIDKKGLENMKAGGVLAIAKGSDEEPYMVHMTYKPKKKAKKRIVLVGKGITFDSGGLSLKPSKGMEDMKIDMGGAAAVLGVMSVIADLKPEHEVHVISAFCENMPSGTAVRPGDVITSMQGKTMEILNTDAEGRVTLADTLYYGSKLKPDAMIDVATLTGASMVALGPEYAALMSNDDKLANALLASADSAGELLWRLPLPDEYRPLIKSSIADLANIASLPYGGAITAGLFLEEFVENTKWAHLDIAGPAYAERETVPYQPKGATGFAVRTMLQFLSEK